MERKKVVLASRCLSGACCRHNGKADLTHLRRLREVARHFGLSDTSFVLVCPPELAGLGTPRVPVRLRAGKIWERGIVFGVDLTKKYREGARLALKRAEAFEVVAVALLANSPSCDPDYGLFGRQASSLGVPVVTFGELLGREHLLSDIGGGVKGSACKPLAVPKPDQAKLFL